MTTWWHLMISKLSISQRKVQDQQEVFHLIPGRGNSSPSIGHSFYLCCDQHTQDKRDQCHEQRKCIFTMCQEDLIQSTRTSQHKHQTQHNTAERFPREWPSEPTQGKESSNQQGSSKQSVEDRYVQGKERSKG